MRTTSSLFLKNNHATMAAGWYNGGRSQTLNINSASLTRGSSFGVNFYNSFVICTMAKKAEVYEQEMSKLGGGCPPLSEALHVAMMWTDVCAAGPVGEA